VDVFHWLNGEGRRRPRSGWSAAPPELTREWPDQARWDVVSHLWLLGTTPETIEQGQRLFVRNCAACHGEGGRGDGPGGRYQPKRPADFTNPRTMLAGTSRLYTAKIRPRRHGHGDAVLGEHLHEEELAALVSYLWTLSLDMDERAIHPDARLRSDPGLSDAVRRRRTGSWETPSVARHGPRR